jgi:hypothetical protein
MSLNVALYFKPAMRHGRGPAPPKLIHPAYVAFRNRDTGEIAVELFERACSEENAQEAPTHSACTNKLENREYFRRECKNFKEVHRIENHALIDKPENSTLRRAAEMLEDLETEYVDCDCDSEDENIPQLMGEDDWIRMLVENAHI